MLKILPSIHKNKFIFTFFLYSSFVVADSYVTNSYNNQGTVGLINAPTARFFDEGVHGLTIYDGNPDQKMTITANPFNWLEASIFYTRVQNTPYCPETDLYDFCKQSLKDKGFNLKARIKEEGVLPAIAVGLYDFAGTGLHSSEYIVASYGINKVDLHLGLGWGQLNGGTQTIKNPLSLITDRFDTRITGNKGGGGQFDPGKYFTGKEASPFFGISYSYNDSLLLKLERDTINTQGTGDDQLIYEERSSDYSFGLDYTIKENFTLGVSYERGNYFSFKFVYKNNPKKSIKKYEYQKVDYDESENKYTKLIKNLEGNSIGVNKITEGASSIGIELTQFVHQDIRVIERIIEQASSDAGIKKGIKKDIKIADLDAYSEIDEAFERNSKLIYERKPARRFETNTGFTFRPFLASREEFFKGAFLVENNSEYVIRDNFFFNANLKYSIADNFDDLRFRPVDTFPAQVRSDIKQYLKNMDKGILIGRAQFDYHYTPKTNHHLMFTAGILEDMFSGFGMEYLYFKQSTNYAFGLELFSVKKRDYDWGFGHLDYENVTLTSNFYYRNYGSIPFDMKISAGEYLAGDVGSTIEFSRTFDNGVKFGAFATFTDVSRADFGEGSFDKGIFFNIPIYGDLLSYTWRPLTKDPGAKLVRRHSLHDLLVRFKPIN
tara:strand:+ start:36203 stop:38188 length:1986 start_codon:yes stop_codon:yes gene_type:complete